MSISILTTVFTLKFKKLVFAHVCGIIFTVNVLDNTSLTVKDTPSIETEPFGAKYFINSSFMKKVIL